MRSLVPFFLLAFSATACCSPPVRDRNDIVLQREQEWMALGEKRKDAVFDLSAISPSNGVDAYVNDPAARRAR